MGFHNEVMRNQAFKKIVAEKPFLLKGAHPCASWRLPSIASWSRMTQREKDDELHRARVHMQFVCRMSMLQHEEGRYFLQNTVKSSCHGERLRRGNSGDDRCQAVVGQSR